MKTVHVASPLQVRISRDIEGRLFAVARVDGRYVGDSYKLGSLLRHDAWARAYLGAVAKAPALAGIRA